MMVVIVVMMIDLGFNFWSISRLQLKHGEGGREREGGES